MQNKRINTNFVPAELIDGDSLNRRFLLNSWGIEPQLFKAELIFRLIITRQIKMFTKVLFKIKTTVNFFQDDTVLSIPLTPFDMRLCISMHA
jgi:hypothetical protein